MDVIQSWWKRSLSNPQVVLLVILLAIGLGVISFAGDILGPLLASLILAYLLDGAITSLHRTGMPEGLALTLIFGAFLAFSIMFLLFIIPVLYEQLTRLLTELPQIFAKGQDLLSQLPEKYPDLFREEEITEVVQNMKTSLLNYGKGLLAVSLTTLTTAISTLVYLVLVPLIIFFMLKDKNKIWEWISGFLPKQESQTLTRTVWSEVNRGIAGYIRGKVIEVAAVWAVTWIAFYFLGLNYAPLLSLLVGLSVIIPYIGIAIVTVPVVLVAYAQWGLGNDFYYLLGVYLFLQFLDANILVPLLFSEAVNLHPIAIILAVLAFGSIWGVWGIFFAIPLATLVNAVLKAWPRQYAQHQEFR